MFLINAKVAPSSIHGLGAFATELIKKGTKVWQFHPLIDNSYTKEAILRLPDSAQIFLYPFIWRGKKSGLYILHGDHARYVNSSETPNLRVEHEITASPEYIAYAGKDIEVGEELTWNYSDFDGVVDEDDSVWDLIERYTGIKPETMPYLEKVSQP